METLLERAVIRGEEEDEALRPVRLAGDKGFRADWIDEYLLAEGITPVIPSKSNEDRDARPIAAGRLAGAKRGPDREHGQGLQGESCGTHGQLSPRWHVFQPPNEEVGWQLR